MEFNSKSADIWAFSSYFATKNTKNPRLKWNSNPDWTKKDGFLLNLGYMCWMILGIAITTVVLFVLFALVGTVDSANYLVGINQFVFSIGYLTVIAVLTALISLPMLNYLDR